MEEAEKAFAGALRILTRRDHSEAELRRKLFAKGFTPESAETTINRLKALGYLDDRRFARSFADYLLRSGKGVGARLQQELRRKGLSREVVDETLAATGAEYDETEILKGIFGARFAGFNAAEASDKEKKRVAAYLQRRGFSLSLILRIFRETEGR